MSSVLNPRNSRRIVLRSSLDLKLAPQAIKESRDCEGPLLDILEDQ